MAAVSITWEELATLDLGALIMVGETPEGPVNIHERGRLTYRPDGTVLYEPIEGAGSG